MRRSPCRSVWIGAATAVFDLVVLAVLHALRTDIDPATDPVSDYAVGDYGTLKVLATLAVGLGALTLTAALHLTVRRRSTVGLVLLAVYGVAKEVQAFFPIDVDAQTTTSGLIHNLLGTLAFLALPVAAVLLSRSSGRGVLAVAVLLAGAMVALLATGALGGYGIVQRVFLVLSSSWVLVIAVQVARRSAELVPSGPAGDRSKS